MAFSQAQDFSITDAAFNEVHRDYNHQEISSNPQTLNLGNSNLTPHIPVSHPEHAPARHDVRDQRSGVISSPIAAYGSNVGGNQTNNVYNYFTFSPGAHQANPLSVLVAKEPQLHPQNVDISTVLDNEVNLRGEKLEWRQSIVDLMKVLRLDPGTDARKRLALGAGYDGDTDDSWTMNIWLSSYVKEVVAAVGCDLTAARQVLQQVSNETHTHYHSILASGAYRSHPPPIPLANAAQPPQNVDISTVLDNAVKLRRQKLNWRQSIVDLMKVLRLDFSMDSRKRLALRAGYDGDITDSTAMNIWLLSYVKDVIAAVGGDLTGTCRSAGQLEYDADEIFKYNLSKLLSSSASMFPNARNFIISNSTFNDSSQESSGLHNLQKHVSPGAFHDSSVRYPPPKCHAETRKHILERITTWIETNTPPSRILWLYGSAGVGKSAIAQTIAEYCLTNDRLGAAFFFSRGDSERNNVNRLFPTLAWQLLSSISEIEASISASMEKDPFLPTRSIETQFAHLIVSPFRLTDDINPQTSRIVIIDGVDECADETMQHRFLSLIGTGVHGGGLPLRFLICSRPEPCIREVFDQSISVSVTSRIVLDDACDSYNDVRRYFVDEFCRISTERNISSDTWPPEGAVDRLVQNSSGQFIYAATVVKFVGDEYANPRKQLDIILGIRCRRGGSLSPFADLDQLYLEILIRQPDQKFLRDFLRLWMVMLENYLTMHDFIKLSVVLLDLDSETGELLAKLRGLHSLLDINIADISIRAYHASFLEFLRDSTRSGQYSADVHSGCRTFFRLFLTPMVKYISKIQQTRGPGLYSYDDNNFKTLVDWRSTFTFILQRIPVDQWEEVLNPLMGLQDVTFFDSVQPFYIVFWCFRMLLLSYRGKLRAERMPMSAGMPYNCLLHSQGLVCAGCHHLDSGTFAYYADQTLILKQLMVECIQTAFLVTEGYYYR
ncbi:hypothetical protein AX14_002819, partial [Amanita brunnescens Koide BX004]